MRCKDINKKNLRFGLTLLEMVLSLTIMAVVFTAVLPQLRIIPSNWDSKQDLAEALQNGRVIVDHINQNLQEALKITSVSASTDSTGYIEFEDNNGTTLRYDIGADNYVQFGEVDNLSDLAGPVSQLQFTCYSLFDFNTPTTEANSIRLVKAQTTITNPSGSDKTFDTSCHLLTNSLGAGLDPNAANQYLIAIDNKIQLSGSLSVSDSYYSAVGPYGASNKSSSALFSNNYDGGKNKFKITNNAILKGDGYVGIGTNIDKVFKTEKGGQITGTVTHLTEEIAIPIPSAPTGLPFSDPNEGDYSLSGSSTDTFTTDRHFRNLYLWSTSTLYIEGDLTILCDDIIEISSGAKLEINSNSSLNFYISNTNNNASNIYGKINANTGDPSKVNIYMLASKDKWIYIDGSSAEVHAAIFAGQNKTYVKNSGQLFGSFNGKELYTADGSIHMDLSLGGNVELRP